MSESLVAQHDADDGISRLRTWEDLGSRTLTAALRGGVGGDARAEEVRRAVSDPLYWLQHMTRTEDRHWVEAGAGGPYRRFPDKPYFAPAVEVFQQERVLFVEKSRDMMLSWLFVGLFTHAAMTVAGREVLLQSQNETKAIELVDYARTLWSQQDPRLKEMFPLSRPLERQCSGLLEWANGSRLVGIPEGAHQVRSYHPWGLLMDEAAYQPQAGEAYEAAVPVCERIVVLSSAGPGWFAEFVQS